MDIPTHSAVRWRLGAIPKATNAGFASREICLILIRSSGTVPHLFEAEKQN
jgi:hypothetical protein